MLPVKNKNLKNILIPTSLKKKILKESQENSCVSQTEEKCTVLILGTDVNKLQFF